MSIVDLYQNGYELGFKDAVSGRRRSADWELPLRQPVILLPGFNKETFVIGYSHGYSVGISGAHLEVGKLEK